MEAYMAPDSRFNRKYDSKKDLDVGDISAHSYHLILLAKNHQGYKNLMKLSTLSYREGFYRKPRIDLEILNQYREGLIVTSACIGGIIGQSILQGRKDLALEYINKFRFMFGEDFYLELMAHEMPEDRVVADALIDFGNRTGTGLIITNDSHFTNRDDATAQEVALCLSSRTTLNNPDHWKFSGAGYWFKSPAEMHETVRMVGYPQQCIDNTLHIANKVEDYAFKLAKYHGHMVPLFKDQTGTKWTTDDSHQKLVMSCWEGLVNRGFLGNKLYEDRLTHELDTMQRKNFSSYFLIIGDIIQYIRRHGRMLPPFGRGSSVGSLVCYVLGITAMDPIRWNVPFYRFINEGRKDLPDIDTDISQRHRGDVIQYIVNTYGAENVAHIVTFQTMAAKKAVDDAGSALDIPPPVRKTVSKLLGETTKEDLLSELLEANDEARTLMQGHPGWIDIAMKLEGVHRNTGLHSAGIVISNDPIDQHVPLSRDSDGFRTTQYDMKDVQDLGLLKLDMLGLRTLDTIFDSVKMIKENYNIDIDVYNIPVDDKATYKTICSGEFVSIFQYDSAGMRQMAKTLTPDSFELLMALNALYRPGPMEPQTRINAEGKTEKAPSIADTFIEARHGRQPVQSWDPSLDVIMADTYGMPLYQEQISEMAKVIAGFDDTEADEYRAAIGKKNKEKFDAAQAKFKSGGMAKGHPEAFMDFLVAALTGFARYGWNRGHAAGYSYISYITAWLETNYPVEYYTALLNTNLDDNEQLATLLGATIQRGIDVKAPDINKSGAYFSTDGKTIYMGLLSVKLLATEALIGILWEREVNGEFGGYLDFVRRCCNLTPIPTSHPLFITHKLPDWDYVKKPEVPPSYAVKSVVKTVIENLVKAGTFTHDTVLTDKDKIATLEKIQKLSKKKRTVEDFVIIGTIAELTTGEDFTRMERSVLEREALNFYLSGHPVSNYSKYMHFVHAEGKLVTPSQIKSMEIQMGVVILGLLVKKEMKTTKTGKPYAVLKIQDQFGEVSLRVWSPLASEIWPMLHEGGITLVRGVTRADNFRAGEIDVQVYAVATATHGLPIRGFIVDQPEKVSEVIKRLHVEPSSLVEMAGYGMVGHLAQTYALSPDVLDAFAGMEGVRLALSV
jgi:DNA polymerase-3 subunit alpha